MHYIYIVILTGIRPRERKLATALKSSSVAAAGTANWKECKGNSLEPFSEKKNHNSFDNIIFL